MTQAHRPGSSGVRLSRRLGRSIVARTHRLHAAVDANSVHQNSPAFLTGDCRSWRKPQADSDTLADAENPSFRAANPAFFRGQSGLEITADITTAMVVL